MIANEYYEENTMNWKVKLENKLRNSVGLNIHLMEVKVNFFFL